MNLEIIIVLLSMAIILVNKLLSPNGLLAFVPMLVSAYMPKLVSEIFAKVFTCTVCVSGWMMIGYSIYLLDWQFAIKNVPVVMALAYYAGKIDYKLSY